MKFSSKCLAALIFLSMGLMSCARYEAIPWQEVPGQTPSVAEVGAKIVSALEVEVFRNQKKLLRRRSGSRSDRRGRSPGRALRIVLAAFSEARTGLRTGFSEKLEEAVRGALELSPLFEVVDGGNGVSWQEAGLDSSSIAPPIGWNGVFGRLDEEISAGQEQGKDLQTMREDLDRQLDEDHPLKGLWPKVRSGRYGEGSAIYAASMLAADAAVYGAYALGSDRVRVWASVVMNRPALSRYYRRGVKDIFGLPEYLKTLRPYLAHARGQVPLKNVPVSWLSAWLPPRPRARPRPPAMWAEPALNVVFERIDPDGRRYPLIGGEIFDSEMLVVGRFAVSVRRHVFGFAVDESGRVEEIFGSAQGEGKSALVEPGKTVHFTARLLPSGRTFRVYFLSSKKFFETKEIIAGALKRLGISESGSESAATYRDVAGGAPRVPWFVPPGQDRLILGDGWDQHVYWFHRVSR